MASKTIKAVSILFLVCLVGACIVGAVTAHDEEPAPMPSDDLELETETEDRIEEPIIENEFPDENPIM